MTRMKNKSNIVEDAMQYLRQVPQMQEILAHLPKNLKYDACVNGGNFSFDEANNRIIMQVGKDTTYPRGKLNFLVSLAHELCHANQKEMGLQVNDLIDPTVRESFRIGKMMELEALLLSVEVENELAAKEEFKGIRLSVACLFYRHLLRQTNGDIAKARKMFILSYWTKSLGTDIEQTLRTSWAHEVKSDIRRWFAYYTKQAYVQTITRYKFKPSDFVMFMVSKIGRFICPPTNRITAVQAVEKYLQRIGLSGMIPPLFFLKNYFDKVELTDNIYDGVTKFYSDGTKYCNYSIDNNKIKITRFYKTIPNDIEWQSFEKFFQSTFSEDDFVQVPQDSITNKLKRKIQIAFSKLR